MKLCIVSAKYPFGHAEPFLDTELRLIAPSFEHVTVFPTSPAVGWQGFTDVPADVLAIPLAGPATVALALRTLARRPGRTLAALGALLGERYPLRAKLKNLAVVPKGLALAELARRRDFDRLHAYWLSTPATVAWLASRVSGIPFSATTHRWDLYENNLARRKLADASFIRTISARGRDDLLRLTGGDAAKVPLVRLGIALEALEFPGTGPAANTDVAAGADMAVGAEPSADPAPPPLRILCAARLVPVKGHEYLVEALRLLRERGVAFACTLAGEGELREEIARRIGAAGLGDAVRLAGIIPHDELLARLRAGAYDVSVIASIEREGGLMEGVPVAIIEAMVAGAVVVATDSGSVGELVDGTTGLLVPHSDAAALAEALRRVAVEPGLRERLRAAARERVEREYDGRRTSARLHELISV